MIYEHGDLWIGRLKRLKQLGALPAGMLVPVEGPKVDDARRYQAVADIVRELGGGLNRRRGAQLCATTVCSIAPNTLAPSNPFISIRMVSPNCMNSVFGAPPSMVSTARFSAMHE